MMLALYLLAGLTPEGVTVVQQRVDELVKRCDASKVIQLIAQDEGRVMMTLLPVPGKLTAAQHQQLTCVLDGMKGMPDLSFGFRGNEGALNGS